MRERPLRLCHVFPTFGTGGSQRRTTTLIRLAGDDFHHTIVSIHGDVASADALEGSNDVDLVPLGPQRLRPQPAVAITRAIREAAPDLLVTYNWGAIEAVVAGRLLGLPVLHAEDGFNPDEADGQKRRRVLARRLLLRGVDGVVLPSRTLLRIASDVWHLPEDRLVHIPNGIDCDRFRPGSAGSLRAALGVPPDATLIGSVGHLNEGKNVALLMRALAVVPDRSVHLLLLGEGPMRSELELLVRDLGLGGRVHFAGRVREPSDHYRAMDLYASASRTEQMPLSVLEAMATGLAVVATDVGDTCEMVAASNRPWIVPADDLPALAVALDAALRSAQARERSGFANRARATMIYDEERMLARYVELWRTACGAVDGARLTRPA